MWYNEVRGGCCHLIYSPGLQKFWKRCGKVAAGSSVDLDRRHSDVSRYIRCDPSLSSLPFGTVLKSTPSSHLLMWQWSLGHNIPVKIGLIECFSRHSDTATLQRIVSEHSDAASLLFYRGNPFSHRGALMYIPAQSCLCVCACVHVVRPVKIWLVCAELFISCRLSWLGLSKKLSCLAGHCISHAPAYSCSGKLPGSQNSHQPPVEELSVTNPVFLPVENHIFLDHSVVCLPGFSDSLLHSQFWRLINQLCIFPGY